MARLLYKLNGVPDDETEEIRALLEEHHIEFYETSAGRWGISVAAIWIRDNEAFAQAKQLLDSYHAERYRQARASYEQQIADGTADTFFARLRREPLRVLVYLLLVALIATLTIVPFIQWALK